MKARDKSILLLGATGTIGAAVHAALIDEGYVVVAPTRRPVTLAGAVQIDHSQAAFERLMTEHDVGAVISCVASRNGLPKDAWAIDYGLNSTALKAAVACNLSQFVMLSAICVQKPVLEFQKAKLAFEVELRLAPLIWSIIRPTAFFKSLSGQMRRLQNGKPFLLFGNGALTKCKPISDRDLARFIVRALSDPEMNNRVLPIGGPGPAISPRQQGDLLFEATGATPRFKRLPVGFLSTIIGVLGILGMVLPRLREKAELARIGRYYATESMLLWDAKAQQYDADATAEFGQDTLAEHYAALAAGEREDDRGAHVVF
ncbi:NAD(P)H-binding protein [Pontivivens insulae]|uniref:Divinyl chlorophyllide a 8-vinyl-reductase, chloroplastic n=1 Tax=Pontivivens insulae TaxID=1639689 RepID=A0A2R8AFL0_9RHOB|nr:NAD(P)H-binding protein [Pontivivens insulae]RED12210.1 divinylchlorophyllide 8-vinylreductase [Pontivivens insulae]SPF30966.1 hypothetical protein POI8812_03312 [Pontivivens insulae]